MANNTKPPALQLNGVALSDGEQLSRDIQRLHDPEVNGLEARFNTISDSVSELVDSAEQTPLIRGATAAVEDGADAFASARTALESMDKIKDVEQTISNFAKSSELIMAGLDAVKQIHPFIGVAVLAFKAAIQLELTRRGNDRKVLMLKSRMTDMMEVLLDLRDIVDERKTGADGVTLDVRMWRVLQDIEKNIRECCAVCEKYVHKRFVVKLFDGARWESRLAAFNGIFVQRKQEVVFAIAVHNTHQLGSIHATMTNIQQQATADMRAIFTMIATPRERQLLRAIEERGGPKLCSENDQLFKEVLARSKDGTTEMVGNIRPENVESLMMSVRADLRADLSRELAEDRRSFDRKFDAVQARIEEMKDEIRYARDSVITALHAGAHDGVLDEDLKAIWINMGWKGSVQANEFIVALQDYFARKESKPDEREFFSGSSRASPAPRHLPDPSPPSPLFPPSPSRITFLPNIDVAQLSSTASRTLQARRALRDRSDAWAVEYISLTRMQPILEAFDDDASGWISVHEVNMLILRRPPQFSLVVWLAFWAAAFRMVSARYASKIRMLRSQMSRVAVEVLRCNRARVDKYLGSPSLCVVDYLVRSQLKTWEDGEEDPSLTNHFEEFLDSEEQQLFRNLERFRWDVDASNTLLLIIGSGRIERHVFALLYLLLSRHFDIIRLARKYPLNDLELYRAERSIDTVIDAVVSRLEVLIAQSRGRSADLQHHFSYAYHGMFSVVYDWYTNHVVEDYEYEAPRAEGVTSAGPDPDRTILAYDSDFAIPDQFYNQPTDDDLSSSRGLWAGRYTGLDDEQAQGWLTARISVTGNTLTGHGSDSIGSFNITGEVVGVVPGNGASLQERVVFRIAHRTPAHQALLRFDGSLDRDLHGEMRSVSGRWGYWVDSGNFTPLGEFYMHRTSSIVARHMPLTTEFERSPARARWSLVLRVVTEQVHRKNDSRKYFRQRLVANHWRRRGLLLDEAVEALRTITPKSRASLRWTRVLQLVREQARRTLWSTSYFVKRRQDKKAAVEGYMRVLAVKEPHRYLRVWPDDDVDYWEALGTLEQRIFPEDAAFYRWIAEQRLQTECVHLDVTCSVCKKAPVGPRYRCLDCKSEDPNTGIDLCINCVSRDVDVGGNGHRQLHTVMRTIRTLHLHDIVRVTKAATVRASVGQQVLTASSTVLKIDGLESPAGRGGKDTCRCFYCQSPVVLPCWYCTECPDDHFLCDSCEAEWSRAAVSESTAVWMNALAKERPSLLDQHLANLHNATEAGRLHASTLWWHVLVKLQPKEPQSAPVPVETRLVSLHSEVEGLKRQLHTTSRIVMFAASGVGAMLAILLGAVMRK